MPNDRLRSRARRRLSHELLFFCCSRQPSRQFSLLSPCRRPSVRLISRECCSLHDFPAGFAAAHLSCVPISFCWIILKVPGQELKEPSACDECLEGKKNNFMHKSINLVCTRAKDPMGVYTEPCELQREGMVRSATCPLRAKRPWSQEMEETVMVDTSSAPVEGGRTEQDQIESVRALLDMTPQIMDCLRDRAEQDGLDRWACERVVLSKDAKVLISGSAQGICPPHRGRRS